MSLFDQLGKGNSSTMPDKNEMNRMLRQLQSNPTAFLQQAGFNVPNGMNLNNPNAILNFLMKSGVANGGMLSKAQQLLSLFM